MRLDVLLEQLTGGYAIIEVWHSERTQEDDVQQRGEEEVCIYMYLTYRDVIHIFMSVDLYFFIASRISKDFTSSFSHCSMECITRQITY